MVARRCLVWRPPRPRPPSPPARSRVRGVRVCVCGGGGSDAPAAPQAFTCTGSFSSARRGRASMSLWSNWCVPRCSNAVGVCDTYLKKSLLLFVCLAAAARARASA